MVGGHMLQLRCARLSVNYDILRAENGRATIPFVNGNLGTVDGGNNTQSAVMNAVRQSPKKLEFIIPKL